MEGYKIKQVRVHVGVGLMGVVVTSIDSTRLGCTIERMDEGFIVEHKNKLVWVPDTNIIYCDLERANEPSRSHKAA